MLSFFLPAIAVEAILTDCSGIYPHDPNAEVKGHIQSSGGQVKTPMLKIDIFTLFYISLKMKMKNLELLDGIIKHTESSGCLVAWKGRNLQVLVSESWDELELSWTTTDGSEGHIVTLN